MAVAAVLLGVVFAAYSIYQSTSTQKSATAWTEYYFNLDGDASSFQDLAKSIGNNPAGQWARLAAATGFLQDGIDALYVNRQEGVSQIKTAIEELEKLKGSSIKELQLQVTHALGKSHESLGQLSEAIAYYRELADSTSISDAERQQFSDRLAYLESDEAKSFYAWFEKLDPKPASPPQLPGDLSVPPTSPTIEFDPADLPALPDAANLEDENDALSSDSVPPPPDTPAEIEVAPVDLLEEPTIDTPDVPAVPD